VAVGDVMHGLPDGPAAFAVGRFELSVRESGNGGCEALGQQPEGFGVRKSGMEVVGVMRATLPEVAGEAKMEWSAGQKQFGSGDLRLRSQGLRHSQSQLTSLKATA
jgi:hypothetical protein